MDSFKLNTESILLKKIIIKENKEKLEVYATSLNAVTPGNSFPSRSSRLAPPPVLT
jgi:hypothetical protein